MPNFLEGLFMASRPGRNYYASQQAIAEMEQKKQQAQLIGSALSSFGLSPESDGTQTGSPPSALKLLSTLAAGGDIGAFKDIIDYQLQGDDRELKKLQIEKTKKDINAPIANTALAKINADLAAGSITPEAAQQLINKETALTEGQSNASLYADRMRESMKVLDEKGSIGTNLAAKAVSKIPLIGNYAVPEDYQLVEQAKRDFINAVLRRESGAAIADSEYENADKQYFAQPGDSPAVIQQKKKNRETAYEGIRRAGGTAAPGPGPVSAPKVNISREQALAELKRRGLIK